MAVGDRIPAELVEPQALSATTEAKYINIATNRVQVTQIWLANTGTATRKVTLYKNGTTIAHTIANAIELAAGASVILDDLKLVLTGAQTIGAKQDAGADVTLAVYGVVEQLS